MAIGWRGLIGTPPTWCAAPPDDQALPRSGHERNRLTLSRFNLDSDSLKGPIEGMTAPVRARLEEPSSDRRVDVSADEAIAITLIDIKRTLSRTLQKLEAAYPDE